MEELWFLLILIYLLCLPIIIFMFCLMKQRCSCECFLVDKTVRSVRALARIGHTRDDTPRDATNVWTMDSYFDPPPDYDRAITMRIPTNADRAAFDAGLWLQEAYLLDMFTSPTQEPEVLPYSIAMCEDESHENNDIEMEEFTQTGSECLKQLQRNLPNAESTLEGLPSYDSALHILNQTEMSSTREDTL